MGAKGAVGIGFEKCGVAVEGFAAFAEFAFGVRASQYGALAAGVARQGGECAVVRGFGACPIAFARVPGGEDEVRIFSGGRLGKAIAERSKDAVGFSEVVVREGDVAHFEEGVGLALGRGGGFGEGAKLREGLVRARFLEQDAAEVEGGFSDQRRVGVLRDELAKGVTGFGKGAAFVVVFACG